MIAVVERVSSASVSVEGEKSGSIKKGMLVLLGVAGTDDEKDLEYIAGKIAGLRIFERDNKMNDSLVDIGGQILLVSQFTLLGDARKGKRPDFTAAAKADKARKLYEQCIIMLREMGIDTQTGVFGADMKVESVGDGPVTILLDSNKRF